MAYEEEKDYLSKMPGSNSLTAISDPEEMDKVLFSAKETLSGLYHPRHITSRVIILQAMYEQGGAQYAALRDQGITNYSTKRGSVSFKDGEGGDESRIIAPKVYAILGAPPANIGEFR